MAYRRIHLSISLIVGAGVWGGYFLHFAQMLRAGDLDGLIWWFLGAVVAAMVMEAAATGLVAWLFRRRKRAMDDGPALNAALKAGHVALMLLIVMNLGFAGLLAFAAAVNWTPDMMASHGLVLAANLVLAMAVIAEWVRAALTLALLPRR